MFISCWNFSTEAVKIILEGFTTFGLKRIVFPNLETSFLFTCLLGNETVKINFNLKVLTFLDMEGLLEDKTIPNLIRMQSFS